MSEQKVMNRWLVVLGAILIQLCLGAVYAWSVFTPRLKAEPYGFTSTQTQWIFGVGLASFALVMIWAGRMQARFQPRQITAIGGVVLGLGYVGARFVGTSFLGHLVTVGLIAGAGIGLAYVVPIAVGVKWFPDKKGMLTGLSVAGFGFGALLWIKLAELFLLDKIGVANVFLTYGIAFAVIVLLGSIWMVNPPEGYRPAGWSPPEANRGGPVAAGSVDLDSAEMRGTPQFYALWLMFLAGAMAGLMVIGCIKLFGIDALMSTGMDKTTASLKAGTAMAVFFALANGLGRIGWGMWSDKLGRKASLFLMLASQGVVMLLFFRMGFQAELLYLGAALIGFNYGGIFALFPAATADFFGNRNVGRNYGWVFSAYGVAGIVGPVLGGIFSDAATGTFRSAWVQSLVNSVGPKLGSIFGGAGHAAQLDAWLVPFVISGVACLAAAIVTLLLKPPAHDGR